MLQGGNAVTTARKHSTVVLAIARLMPARIGSRNHKRTGRGAWSLASENILVNNGLANDRDSQLLQSQLSRRRGRRRHRSG
jgi:hypothetical protein